MRSNPLLHTTAALAMLSLLVVRSADAEIIYWNGTASPGNVWSDTTAWSTTTGATTPPPIAPPGASDDVVFNISTDNSPETVRLNGAQSALSILFRSTGTTTLLGGTNDTAADDTLTIGTGGITLQAGAGAVTIGQAASPGQVAVALAASQTWTNNSSSLFTVANGIARATGDTTDRTLTVAGSGSTTLDGVIANGGASGTLGLTKTGNGTLTLTAASTFTGATSISGGTLTLSGAAGALGGTSGITLSRNATLTLSNTAAANNTNRIANAAGLTATGGTFNFTHTAGAANYAETIGALSIAGGAFRANLSQAATGQTSAVTAASWARSAGGTALFSGTGLGVDTRNRFIFTATPTLTNFVLQGAVHLNGSTYSLATHGANGIAALVSSGTAETSWVATINARPTSSVTVGANRSLNSLILGSGVNLNAPSGDRTITFTNGSGTILQTGGTSTISSGGTSNANEYIFAFGTGQALFHVYGTLNFNRGNATNQITGSGGMVKAGTGTLALNVPSSVTGGFWINEGTVNLGNATALGATSNPVTVHTGTLNIGANNISIGPLAGGPTARINPNTTAGTRLLTTTFTSGTHEFAGTLTDNSNGILALTKAGDGGTLVLSGANSFTGGVTISGGSITITNSAGLGTGTKTVTMNQANVNPTLVLDGTTGPITLPGSISFTTSSQSAQRGIVNLTGTNEIQGNVTLSTGGGNTNFEVVGGSLTLSGTLTTNTTARNVQLSGVGNGLVSGVIQDGSTTNTLGLIKQGAGTWTLSNANTFTGGTTISGGALRLTNPLALQNTVVTLSGGGVTFDESVAADAFTFGGLGGTGGLVLANNATTPEPIALTLGSNNATSSRTGAISGAGSLTKVGNGILTLSGTNSYSGGTTVSAGILTLGATTALPGDATPGAWTVASGGTLAIGNAVSPGYLVTLESPGNVALGGWMGFDTTAGNRPVPDNLLLSGGLAKVGTNTLTLSGTNAVAGGFRTVAGTLQFNSPAATGGAPITISGGSTSFLFDGNGGAAGSGGNGTGALQTIDFASGLTVAANGTLVVGRLAGYGTTYATAANKTAQFDTLSIGANTLTVTNSNGFGALFSGATTFTGAPTLSIPNATASDLVQGLTLAGPVAGSFGLT